MMPVRDEDRLRLERISNLVDRVAVRHWPETVFHSEVIRGFEYAQTCAVILIIIVFVSSIAPDGLQELRGALLTAARKGTEIAEIRLPATDGKLLAEIYRTGSVLSQRTDDGQIVLRARVDEQLAGRLERSGASVAYQRQS